MPVQKRRLALAVLPLLALSAAAIRIQTTSPKPPAPFPSQTTPVKPAPSRPATPLDSRQWNLSAIGIEEAWRVSPGAPVSVAVLDTGYAELPTLSGRVVNGHDFVSNAAVSGDGDGRDADARDGGETAYHGTMVAGLIGAAPLARGLAGVNPRARLVQVRVADTNGQIAVEDLVDALRWAVGLSVPGAPRNPFPARVVNLSLFADFIPLDRCDARVQAALNEVTALGVVVVAGAGNDDANAQGYTPAGCEGVITVTATDRAGRRAGYANWGSAIALAAPGGTNLAPVLVETPRGVSRQTGTSLAAPLVSGVVSLMLGVNPTLRPAEVAALLRATAAPFPNGTCDPAQPGKSCGAGLLNAGRAVQAAKNFRPKAANGS